MSGRVAPRVMGTMYPPESPERPSPPPPEAAIAKPWKSADPEAYLDSMDSNRKKQAVEKKRELKLIGKLLTIINVAGNVFRMACIALFFVSCWRQNEKFIEDDIFKLLLILILRCADTAITQIVVFSAAKLGENAVAIAAQWKSWKYLWFPIVMGIIEDLFMADRLNVIKNEANAVFWLALFITVNITTLVLALVICCVFSYFCGKIKEEQEKNKAYWDRFRYSSSKF